MVVPTAASPPHEPGAGEPVNVIGWVAVPSPISAPATVSLLRLDWDCTSTPGWMVRVTPAAIEMFCGQSTYGLPDSSQVVLALMLLHTGVLVAAALADAAGRAG